MAPLFSHEKRVIRRSTTCIQNLIRPEAVDESSETVAPDKVAWVGETKEPEVCPLKQTDIASIEAGTAKLTHDPLLCMSMGSTLGL